MADNLGYMERDCDSAEAKIRFEAVFLTCHDAVVRYSVRRVAAQSVQDVVAETFLVAWRRFDDLEGDPLPWLLGIARRVAANQRRSFARRAALIERLRGERGLDAAVGDIDSMDPRLAAALALLSERDREAILLVVWDELSHRNAATVLGCTTGALAVRLHRARRRLADALRESHHPGGCMIAEVRSAP